VSCQAVRLRPMPGTRRSREGYRDLCQSPEKASEASSSRCSKYGAAASVAEAIVPAASWCPYLASPPTISELLCGQPVPVWYRVVVSRPPCVARVRTPSRSTAMSRPPRLSLSRIALAGLRSRGGTVFVSCLGRWLVSRDVGQPRVPEGRVRAGFVLRSRESCKSE
jgi:hypothetical protein